MWLNIVAEEFFVYCDKKAQCWNELLIKQVKKIRGGWVDTDVVLIRRLFKKF